MVSIGAVKVLYIKIGTKNIQEVYLKSRQHLGAVTGTESLLYPDLGRGIPNLLTEKKS